MDPLIQMMVRHPPSCKLKPSPIGWQSLGRLGHSQLIMWRSRRRHPWRRRLISLKLIKLLEAPYRLRRPQS